MSDIEVQRFEVVVHSSLGIRLDPMAVRNAVYQLAWEEESRRGMGYLDVIAREAPNAELGGQFFSDDYDD